MATRRKLMTPWMFDGQPVESIPDGMYGFVYEIVNKVNGKRYIGRKYFWSVSGKGKKAITKESNWTNYFSSSADIKNDLKEYGTAAFDRTIIAFFANKRDVDYGEVAIQFAKNVLGAHTSSGEKIYYNSNISGRWYPRTEMFVDTPRQRIVSGSISFNPL